MHKKYTERKTLNLPVLSEEIAKFWQTQAIFEKSISNRASAQDFVFYEGPPSANGLPGIHHVMARGIKDIFCRYKTLQGFRVLRKAGWDTHGLPVELGVEKELGITKEDIGKKISIADYNKKCKEVVMRYTNRWKELTEKMGYWTDMENPYITYKNTYIESVWWLLGELHKKNLLYKGYSIQPYSPKAGTGLSSHELNQPGCYRMVKDTSIVAQFQALDAEKAKLAKLFKIETAEDFYFLAWTTTPWTLPSNTALAVGENIKYALVRTQNPYSQKTVCVILAEDLLNSQMDKKVPHEVLGTCLGKDLLGVCYAQLLPYTLPCQDADKAFQVIAGDFVSTQDGTGIVHIAPTFGADDMRVAKQAGVPPMLVLDENGNAVPLVDLQGKFRKEMKELAGMYVKNEYYSEQEMPEKSADVLIAIQLKERGLAFKVEKYEHSYPHCWRTDKPILYYPLDSWFIKVSAMRTRLQELNNTIRWQPESTGKGRFGNWLENASDWNLSRSRYWGIPLPIWRTEDGSETLCISSVEALKNACQTAVEKGFMAKNPLADYKTGDFSEQNYETFDLHKPFVDDIILCSPSGKPMKREADLIDVWFDSGAMPYAQAHYPFATQKIDFPADFIAEGVDQTRGWFYTLHVIAGLCFDSVAYKNVLSNGLVLDKNGQKMSKRLGNTIEPFEALAEYGADAVRWYMIANAQPWDNLKFDIEGVTETQRKFFRALHNTYSFFALYANVDGFDFSEPELPIAERSELDAWILSRLNSLIIEVQTALDNYDPTTAARKIQDFTVEELSNWYVRLSRRRFWKTELGKDKTAAYQTLYTCLETLAILASPIAPFYTEQLFLDLNSVTHKQKAISVHLTDFPKATQSLINPVLEQKMELARRICSLTLGLRKKEELNVRQPLQKLVIPVFQQEIADAILAVQDLILSETNIKQLELLQNNADLVFQKSIKANFKSLGEKYGKHVQAIAKNISTWTQADIAHLEQNGSWQADVEGVVVSVTLQDVLIQTEDLPGWSFATDRELTVALDITLTDALRAEGMTREFINRVQNYRKELNLHLSDKISLCIETSPEIAKSLEQNKAYFMREVLADTLIFGTVQEENCLNISEEHIQAKIYLRTRT
jgi:isoleucyl-tRNA synthetase